MAKQLDVSSTHYTNTKHYVCFICSHCIRQFCVSHNNFIVDRHRCCPQEKGNGAYQVMNSVNLGARQVNIPQWVAKIDSMKHWDILIIGHLWSKRHQELNVELGETNMIFYRTTFGNYGSYITIYWEFIYQQLSLKEAISHVADIPVERLVVTCITDLRWSKRKPFIKST